jgi:hypothetical protein
VDFGLRIEEGRAVAANPQSSMLSPRTSIRGRSFLEVAMVRTSTTTWRLDRRVNLSVLLQVMVLASMILASWVNLQRQLDLLQHDVTMLLQNQKESQQRLEVLSERSLSHEYRLQIMEKGRNG